MKTLSHSAAHVLLWSWSHICFVFLEASRTCCISDFVVYVCACHWFTDVAIDSAFKRSQLLQGLEGGIDLKSHSPKSMEQSILTMPPSYHCRISCFSDGFVDLYYTDLTALTIEKTKTQITKGSP